MNRIRLGRPSTRRQLVRVIVLRMAAQALSFRLVLDAVSSHAYVTAAVFGAVACAVTVALWHTLHNWRG